jgi:hypothetical protein
MQLPFAMYLCFLLHMIWYNFHQNVHLNGHLACLQTVSTLHSVVHHHFRLIDCLPHLTRHAARLSGCLDRIMAKQQVTDYLPFNV